MGDNVEYDSIGTQYDVIKITPFNEIERTNFQRSVEPFLQQPNTSVIDFACGTGFYSEFLLKWGAASLTGIDISSVMVDGAKARLSKTPFDSQSEFITGDCSKPTLYNDSRFDVATGVWFIVYAKDMEELTGMFRCVSMNLKQDGVFVAVCHEPTDDMDGRAAIMNEMRPLFTKTGVVPRYEQKLENGLGYTLRICAIPPPGAPPSVKGVEFDGWNLKKSAIEDAARAGGMQGKIEWRPVDFLGEGWRKKIGLEGDDEGWEKIQRNPYLNVLVIWKS